MKATIEIPDDLYRQLKARSALEGTSIRKITVELYRRWLVERVAPANGLSAEEWLEEWGRLGTAKLHDAPSHPTATEILAADRNRLE